MISETWSERRRTFAAPRLDGDPHCAWARCGRRFTPRDDAQIYCCAPCREAAKNWRKGRAPAIVDALIEWSRLRGSTDETARRQAGAALNFATSIVRDWRHELARMAAERDDVEEIKVALAYLEPDRRAAVTAQALSAIGLDLDAVIAATGLRPHDARRALAADPDEMAIAVAKIVQHGRRAA